MNSTNQETLLADFMPISTPFPPTTTPAVTPTTVVTPTISDNSGPTPIVDQGSPMDLNIILSFVIILAVAGAILLIKLKK